MMMKWTEIDDQDAGIEGGKGGREGMVGAQD